ncbi:hypothetical protein [Variovorax terrae]|uniref:hypothetical protein n=1 Tax=Variovorax terrae TaxID=2923278 RepID=UPI003C701EE2
MATQARARIDAKTVAIFGTGTQAACHAQAFAALPPSLSITVRGSSPQKSRQFRDKPPPSSPGAASSPIRSNACSRKVATACCPSKKAPSAAITSWGTSCEASHLGFSGCY